MGRKKLRLNLMLEWPWVLRPPGAPDLLSLTQKGVILLHLGLLHNLGYFWTHSSCLKDSVAECLSTDDFVYQLHPFLDPEVLLMITHDVCHLMEGLLQCALCGAALVNCSKKAGLESSSMGSNVHALLAPMFCAMHWLPVDFWVQLNVLLVLLINNTI